MVLFEYDVGYRYLSKGSPIPATGDLVGLVPSRQRGWKLAALAYPELRRGSGIVVSVVMRRGRLAEATPQGFGTPLTGWSATVHG